MYCSEFKASKRAFFLRICLFSQEIIIIIYEIYILLDIDLEKRECYNKNNNNVLANLNGFCQHLVVVVVVIRKGT